MIIELLNHFFTLGQENKNIIKSANKISSETKKYQGFCKTFGLKQLRKSPTRVAPNTSTLIDHILTNTNEKTTQCGQINIGLSDHQMIFCMRKIEKKKVGGHKQISFRYFKTYSVDEYEIYKETRNGNQRTFKQDQNQYLEEKLSGKIAKPKQLWPTLKSLGLLNKKNSPSNICLKNKNGLSFDSLPIAETF